MKGTSMEDKPLNNPATRKAAAKRAKYESPRIQTFSSEQILSEIGPAQGYSGSVPGTIGGGGL